MGTARVRLGELLVEAQIISREQLEEALRLQKQDNRRIGTLLVDSLIVSHGSVLTMI